MTNPDAVDNLSMECEKLFARLSSIQIEIRNKLSAHSDGKNLKGNELVGWLGEIYGKLLFDGQLVNDKYEYDFITPTGYRVSVKTRKGWKSGWKQTSAIPKIEEDDDCPTHLLFVHLNDDYSIDRMWLFSWHRLIIDERFAKHMVRGRQRSYIFRIDELKDKQFIVYGETQQQSFTAENTDGQPLTYAGRKIVNENELVRKLNSVGKSIFVEYFLIFKEYSSGKLSKEECIELLVSSKVSNDAGAAIRCGNAKLIFESQGECDALNIIIKSSRLSSIIVNKAKQLINDYCR